VVKYIHGEFLLASDLDIMSGRAHPLGATPSKTGVNFSIFSENATSVELLLFDSHTSPEPFKTIILDAKKNNTFHFWHVFVKGLKPGVAYAYRVAGSQEANEYGHRFNYNKVLIDPYARANTSELWRREDSINDSDNVATSMRSVVVDIEDYDWEGDQPLNLPMSDTIIYEMHVGGFTKSHNSNCQHRGKFAGLVEKIPYLKSLGITAVELMPVFDFDSSEVCAQNSTSNPLKNYWGYGTIGYYAPENSYTVSPNEGAHTREFRDMVKALHNSGIEVILDVVFGYTGEGDQNGPIISFKGLDNSVYYLLSPEDRQYYLNLSGCGNTLNCNHPIVGKFITDCLEFWVKEMHVDGFRFDEGSILSRGEDGVPLKYPPVLWNVELSEALSKTKIIAEAWDAAGLYQVGYFPGYRYAEWNGRFRDDIRKFVRGDAGMTGQVAQRITGSPDLYQSSGRPPANSVNFVTCHDGFTMNDLVSYNSKHNEANGHDNTDGLNENLSSNYGIEGPTNDKTINDFRERQIKNFFTIMMLSRGTPMISMGDEVRRTQQGNNNAYRQDNELSWFDWSSISQNKSLLDFVIRLIEFRKSHYRLRENEFFSGEKNSRGLPDISFHGCELYNPGFNDPGSKVIAFTLGGQDDEDIHVMMNMDESNLEFDIPSVQNREWQIAFSTSDGFDKGGGKKIAQGGKVEVCSHAIVVLVSR